MRRQVRPGGFSLLELLVALAIVGILAAIAYPSYMEHVNRAKRAEGRALLHEVAARQERFFAQNFRYVVSDDLIGQLGMQALSPNGHYRLALGEGPGGYQLTAVPQWSDPRCSNLTLDATGVRGPAAVDCWR